MVQFLLGQDDHKSAVITHRLTSRKWWLLVSCLKVKRGTGRELCAKYDLTNCECSRSRVVLPVVLSCTGWSQLEKRDGHEHTQGNSLKNLVSWRRPHTTPSCCKHIIRDVLIFTNWQFAAFRYVCEDLILLFGAPCVSREIVHFWLWVQFLQFFHSWGTRRKLVHCNINIFTVCKTDRELKLCTSRNYPVWQKSAHFPSGFSKIVQFAEFHDRLLILWHIVLSLNFCRIVENRWCYK